MLRIRTWHQRAYYKGTAPHAAALLGAIRELGQGQWQGQCGATTSPVLCLTAALA